MYNLFIKRLLDICFSLLFIILFSPLYVVLSIFNLINLGSPIFFRQKRIGKDESFFVMYKFRSMTNEKDINGDFKNESYRVTKYGSFLRSSSLDELPELFCIFLGKMSFIGPRPLPVYYLPFFKKEERLRHRVKGGLIPPDVLSGKSITTWEEQFLYEVDYSKKVTFMKDFKIFYFTFKILFQRFNTNYGESFRPHLNIYRKKEKKKNE